MECHAMNPVPIAFPRSRGFTLIELAVAMAVAATLFALAAPAVSSLLEGGSLSGAAQLAADQISLGRQLAAAQNRTVEVRIAQLPRETGGVAFYDAIQLWANDGSNTMRPLTRLTWLPREVVFSQHAAFSPLCFSGSAGTMPYAGASAAYVAFQISPAGMVSAGGSIPAMKETCLALVPSRFASNDALPPNYAVLQINPNTGTPKVYRP